MKYPARCPFGSIRYQIEKKHTRPFQTEEKTETSWRFLQEEQVCSQGTGLLHWPNQRILKSSQEASFVQVDIY